MFSNYSVDISYEKFCDWLSTEVGREFIDAECIYVNNIYNNFTRLRGALVLGNELFFKQMQGYISKICLDFYNLNYKIQNISELDKLKDNNYSLVYLPHILEFSLNPKLILNIASDALCDGGYIVITNFNIFSLLAASKLNKKSLDDWPYRWIVGLNLIGCMRDLNLAFTKIQYFGYGLPYCVEACCCSLPIPFGGSYMLVLQKQSIPLSLAMA